ncbi:metalloenzyme [Marinithermus hydrothermalis]|uniref:Metalloenzyme domain protein n=1 Tax=Marinithermus hydrothermalis (strain DSM 14884 / JCM 11576 / T1) TaxID=869210 RepID=F2NMT3_MARHT|nr:metalloenzyme [Marinithermus hydrothermalis]AEB12467.1 metalloenzyme domain protein [Marinithermus hydrothermalis DSM 14884]
MLALLFVDGLGVSAHPESPLRHVASLPPEPRREDGVCYQLLDARLGLEGLPQSATGQTSLLTGRNAARLLGYHHGPFPGPTLRALLAEESLQVRAVRRGLRVHHANGYRSRYLELLEKRVRHVPLSAFGYAARAAGLPLLPLEHPEAVHPMLPDPEAAALRFAALSERYDLVILEHWALDLAGHRDPAAIRGHLERLDRFLEAFRRARPKSSLVLISDHGNAEEPWHTAHTTNPVPFLVLGPLAAATPELGDIVAWGRWVQRVVLEERT